MHSCWNQVTFHQVLKPPLQWLRVHLTADSKPKQSGCTQHYGLLYPLQPLWSLKKILYNYVELPGLVYFSELGSSGFWVKKTWDARWTHTLCVSVSASWPQTILPSMSAASIDFIHETDSFSLFRVVIYPLVAVPTFSLLSAKSVI